MIRTISAIAVAAAIAAGVTILPSLSASVEARSNTPALKIEPVEATSLAAGCAQQAWPYIEAKCLRDSNRPMGQARDVRLVALDRAHTETATEAKVR
jgi:hypothetical protein